MSQLSSVDRVVLLLFYNDLRIHDNAALRQAAKLCSSDDNSRLLLVYAPLWMDKQQQNSRHNSYDYPEMGKARQQFLSQSLQDLDRSLQRLGNRLCCLPVQRAATDSLQPSMLQRTLGQAGSENKVTAPDSEGEVWTQLCALLDSLKVTDICVSHCADYDQKQAYQALQSKYPTINWHVSTTATLFEQLPTKQLPASFSQFRKQIETKFNLLTATDEITVAAAPSALPPMPEHLTECLNKSLAASLSVGYEYQLHGSGGEDSTSVGASASQFPQLSEGQLKGGETQALKHLQDYFNSAAPSTYKVTRNALDEWSHSTKFSPWLANGSLSVKTLLQRLRQYQREVVSNDSTYWIWFELLWREYFYWYGVTHDQKLFYFQGIRQQAPNTQFHHKRLMQWKNGTTAYPIVNACMHQLNTTGYMSNRGRQLVASCLIHELGLDWRYGAAYFEQQLIDYDVASNWGNWQYLAGVGADPRGCRQFNLIKQTQQHDPQGEFIARWQG